MFTLFNILSFRKGYLVSLDKLNDSVVRQYVNALVKRTLEQQAHLYPSQRMSKSEVLSQSIRTMAYEVSCVMVEGRRITAEEREASCTRYEAFAFGMNWDYLFPVKKTYPLACIPVVHHDNHLAEQAPWDETEVTPVVKTKRTTKVKVLQPVLA